VSGATSAAATHTVRQLATVLSDGLPLSDILLGAILLAGFLVVAWAGGSLARARTMARYRRWLAPHAGLVGGTVGGDAECIVIHGTYRGRRVTLALSPHVVDGITTESGQGSRVFEITVRDVAGSHDWEIANRRNLLLRRRWEIRAGDPLIRRRLEESGLMDMLPDYGIDSWLRYDARGQWLGSRMEVIGAPVPPAGVIRDQLELIANLADWHAATPHDR
jgi:hypothetical protein